ncbi:hypothetical protein CUMW_225290 [Citrus unshiu]|uniref:Leucine-rich repeat-containing N-terminal plant-type domain-containing protein n=1 Tax=Citrus unshiu TaxID=55188 RepID=A0A2H5QGR5_CITUN|nr:hypothetical protein CUMW_225290 [Citrus unshiu]
MDNKPSKPEPLLLSLWNLYPINATNFGIHCNSAKRVISINLNTIGLKVRFTNTHSHQFLILHILIKASIYYLASYRLKLATPPISSSLGNNRLSGVIPPEIGLLTHLKHLHIDMNKLHGSENLKFLSTVDLSKNKFSSSMPNSLRKVKPLLSLGFALNYLSGVIAPSIGNLSNLKGLYLYSNRLSHSIRAKIGNLMQLTELEMDNNKLFGQIPKSLRNFTSLNRVHLEQNHLNGNTFEHIPEPNFHRS